jgi:P-type Cu+ transporter
MRVAAPPPMPETETTEQYDLPITGMTCAACARRIEKVLNRQPGVNAASVNFATERATVTIDPQTTDLPAIAQAVEDAGYGTILPQSAPTSEGQHAHHQQGASSAEDTLAHAHAEEYRSLWRRFLVAAVLSSPCRTGR